MKHAWEGYRQHAFGHDELAPVSNGFNDKWGGWGVTLVDALDTLYIMGLFEEFKEGVTHVVDVDFGKARDGYTTPFFEMIIRSLAGLLAAYEMSNDRRLLKKAQQVGDSLFPAFNTTTGIPYPRVDVNKGVPVPSSHVCLAEAGTVQLEYWKLSELTGNEKYHQAAQRVVDILDKADKPYPGLYPIWIEISSGKMTSGQITFGGQGDSWYEYMLKQYLYGRQKHEQYKRMYIESIDAMKEKMIRSSIYDSGMVYLGDLDSTATNFNPKLQHLTCFVPGMLALGSKSLNRPDDMDLAKKLMDTCFQMYNLTTTGLGPEYVLFRDSDNKGLSPNKDKNDFEIEELSAAGEFEERVGFYYGKDRSYILRPETVESLMVLYRTTGDPKYKEWGWQIFQSIEAYTKTPTAYSAYKDVMSTKANSQGCPGFAQEFISTNATTRFVWYPLNDINAFDKALTEYVNGQSNFDEFQAVFRCSGLDDLGGFQKDHGKSVIRYHRSIICADLIASKDNTDECYKAPTKGRRSTDPGMELAKIAAVQVGTGRPKALCRATCNEWVDSLETIISNSTLCAASSGINREATLESLRDKCKTAQFNGSKGSCVSGDDNEPGTCGYQRVEDWCKNCKYASDYPDACMSAGIHVSSSNNNLHGDDSRTRGGYQPTATNTHETLDSLIADLEKQAHQERLYRIAAIILSIAVGICLIALMILILTSGSRNSGAAGILGRRKDAANNAGLDGVLGMGTAERVERTMDFVDCFVSAVGKPRPVMRHFFARRDDEISLQQGDIVTLQMAFDDGWVVGKNLTTGGEGTFPLMCVMDNLPPSMPAQWSVLPENKMASNDNVRRPTQAVTRNSHPSSQNGSGSVVSNTSHYHSSIGISAMGNLSDPARRQGLGNMSRMSNLTVAPAITSTNIPSHASSRSSRPHHGGSTVLDHTSIDHVHRQPIENNHENTGILGRLLGAFTHGHTMTFGRISHADIGSHSLEPLKEESRGP
ncbi:hypothetical protein FBU59_000934, partial [Linderina macrospora]